MVPFTVRSGSTSAAACVTPSLVFANTVFSAVAWGSINGSGLQPGAQVFFCADQVPNCFLTGFVPAANGTLVSSFIFSLQVDCYTNGYFRTKNVAGTTIESNKVNAPPQASCAAAN